MEMNFGEKPRHGIILDLVIPIRSYFLNAPCTPSKSALGSIEREFPKTTLSTFEILLSLSFQRGIDFGRSRLVFGNCCKLQVVVDFWWMAVNVPGVRSRVEQLALRVTHEL